MCSRYSSHVSLLISVILAWSFSGCTERADKVSGESRPNVILIIADDLNDWLGCYGDPQALTPNIDRLADRGVLFDRAYCAAPVCNASRVSVMSGKYPYTTGIYSDEPMLYHRPDLVTLPAHMRSQGYTVHGGGKVFHQTAGNIAPGAFDSYYHWKEGAAARAGGMDYPANYADLLGVSKAQMAFSSTASEGNNQRFDYYALDDKLEAQVADSLVAGWAVDFLRQAHDKPFMLAVGLYSPHKPNYAPEHYYDMYPSDRISLPTVPDNDLEDVPANIRKFRQRRSVGRHDVVIKHNEWAGYVRGYLASVSYADAQVGRILDALDSSAYRDNTIIVFFSDNGYHHGEKRHWGKKTLWERATHVPMIIAGPGIAPGQRCGTPVSLVDLYPTLTDLCGLPAGDSLDGQSLVGSLQDPLRTDDRHVVTTWQHSYGDLPRRPSVSVRSRRWRYSRYIGGGEELYDERQDPGELHNLAGDPEYAQVLADMKGYLPKEMAKPVAPLKDLTLVIEGDSFHWVLSQEASEGEATREEGG